VDAAVPTESHTEFPLTAVCPLSAETWETASLISDDVPDPPPPMPLLFIPLILKGTTHFALLHSDASDSFISADVVKHDGLRPVPLKEEWHGPILVRVALCAGDETLPSSDHHPLTDFIGVPIPAAVQPHEQLEKQNGADRRVKEDAHDASGTSIQRYTCSIVRRHARRVVTGDASLG